MELSEDHVRSCVTRFLCVFVVMFDPSRQSHGLTKSLFMFGLESIVSPAVVDNIFVWEAAA